MAKLIGQGAEMGLEVPEMRHLKETVEKLDEWQAEVSAMLAGKPTMEQVRAQGNECSRRLGIQPRVRALDG